VAILDGMDLVEEALAYIRPYGIDVYVFDETGSRDLVYFHRSRLSTTAIGADPHLHAWTADHRSVRFPFAGRDWVVYNEPVLPVASQAGAPWLPLGIGLALTALVTFVLGRQVRLRRAVEHQVDRRTKQLHKTNRELQEEVEQRRRTERELAAARDQAMESS